MSVCTYLVSANGFLASGFILTTLLRNFIYHEFCDNYCNKQTGDYCYRNSCRKSQDWACQWKWFGCANPVTIFQISLNYADFQGKSLQTMTGITSYDFLDVRGNTVPQWHGIDYRTVLSGEVLPASNGDTVLPGTHQ